MTLNKRQFITLAGAIGLMAAGAVSPVRAAEKQIVYLSAGLEAPFWRYVSEGVADAAKEHGYSFVALDSRNNAQSQLQNAQDAIVKGASGIVLSPTDSSTAPAVLDLASKANIPVSFAGIGTVSGDYVTFVTSNDEDGAYAVGKELAKAFADKGWTHAKVGLVMISQARQNGVKRTNGFVKAMTEAGHSIVARNEMQLYTADETFRYVQDMLTANPELRGIFVQTDTPTLGATRAVDAMRRAGDTLVAAFDGVPEFITLIKDGSIVASGMQQPYLMGKTAAETVIKKLEGGTPDKQVVLPILTATKDNIDALLPQIKQSVFAGEVK
ncbi:substrate-binding domain-containing protein [Labrys monachus]|uniref:Simple sugar transport system substrate-binding protein/ribose transport system substrate-binding protein n=1 Tax=Labrys monachus TaxID=217067 RepID=A0ABU0FEQ3_9HYPH|nr:substrate-binding domain-containing protein [Labrys monachus]MDQ0393086.1 simple sugar transport system substrate-binding protein/ribose transport system substrate-binding protein [Labrys monachus]